MELKNSSHTPSRPNGYDPGYGRCNSTITSLDGCNIDAIIDWGWEIVYKIRVS